MKLVVLVQVVGVLEEEFTSNICFALMCSSTLRHMLFGEGESPPWGGCEWNSGRISIQLIGWWMDFEASSLVQYWRWNEEIICADCTAALLIILLPPKEVNLAHFSLGSDVGKSVYWFCGALEPLCVPVRLYSNLHSSNSSLHIYICLFLCCFSWFLHI